MISVAVDGPSGAGKSSISKEVAKRLKFLHIDTGAMYRAVAYYAFENNILSEAIPTYLKDINIEIAFCGNNQIVKLNGEDVSYKIRTPEISSLASQVSKIKEVRDFLLLLQRNFAKTDNVIMDGRDIGTVVLPEATVKIYLTASNQSRAQRRHLQLKKEGINCEYSQILNGIIDRDREDSSRELSPLKKAHDAIYLDTTNLSFEESVNKIIEIIQAATRQESPAK